MRIRLLDRIEKVVKEYGCSTEEITKTEAYNTVSTRDLGKEDFERLMEIAIGQVRYINYVYGHTPHEYQLDVHSLQGHNLDGRHIHPHNNLRNQDINISHDILSHSTGYAQDFIHPESSYDHHPAW